MKSAKITQNKPAFALAFTLIELLVVISIFAMLTIGGCQAYKAITRNSGDSKFHNSPSGGVQNAESYR